ncbi:MAG: (Fe-S)-binding protein [bacterium]
MVEQRNVKAEPGAGQLDLFDAASDKSAYEILDQALPEIQRCLKCGLCKSACPIYAETLDESSSARGRIAIAEALRESGLSLGPLVADRLGKCLNCKACMDACPSGIKVDEIVLAARAEIFKKGRFPLLKKLVFRNLLKRGRLLPPVGKTVAFIERKILRGLPPSSPYRILLPLVKLDRDRLLPIFAEKALTEELPEVVTPKAPARMRVGFFSGCATNLIYTGVGKDVVRALVGEGIEVVIPRDQGCCGVPVYTAGDRETARALARRNAEAFGRHRVDAIVTACASCGLALKRDYETMLGLGRDPLGAKVYDFAEFLVKHSKLEFARTGLPATKATYHYPCHLNRGQGIKEAPRKVLEALSGVEFVEMEQADRCCGGAGTFSLSYYDLARAVGARKANYVAASGADVVATSCPSCMMQLADMLGRNGLPQKVVHLAELVAACYPPLEESAELPPGKRPR